MEGVLEAILRLFLITCPPDDFDSPCCQHVANRIGSASPQAVAAQHLPRSREILNLRVEAAGFHSERYAVGEATDELTVGRYALDGSYTYRVGLRHEYLRDVGASIGASGLELADEFPETRFDRQQARFFFGMELPAPKYLGNSLWIGGSYDRTWTRFPEDGDADWTTSAYTGLLRLNLTRRPWQEQPLEFKEGRCRVNPECDALHDYRNCGGDPGRHYVYAYHRHEAYDDSTAGDLRTGLPISDRRTGVQWSYSWPRSLIESEHIDGLFNQIDEEDYVRWSFWGEALEQRSGLPGADLDGYRYALSWSLPWIRAEDPLISVEARAGYESYDFLEDDFRRVTLDGGVRFHLRHVWDYRHLTKLDVYTRARTTNWINDGRGPFWEASAGVILVIRKNPKDTVPEGGGSDIDKLPGSGSAPPVIPPNLINGNG